MGAAGLVGAEEEGMGCRLQMGGLGVEVRMDWEDMGMVVGRGRGIERNRRRGGEEEVAMLRFCMIDIVRVVYTEIWLDQAYDYFEKA
jgi:hypothetical protein